MNVKKNEIDIFMNDIRKNYFKIPENYDFYDQKSSMIRLSALQDAVRAGKGHLGGSFSCIELLVALYYGNFLRINSNDYLNKDRDFFIMGKGHACLALYPILKDLGFISRKRYLEYGKDGSSIGGQLDISIPGVEYNTGSLGHALGICAGIALESKIKNTDRKAVAMIGDAECDEGSIWEAILFAGEQSLKNLICIIDRNRLSVLKKTESSVLFKSFKKKMELFNWNCDVINGHSYVDIFEVLKKSTNAEKPTMILANTIKGKGVSFMENEIKWHHGVPTKKEVEIAQKELGLN